MKIVRIITRLNVGGPARHVVWLNQALSENDYHSILIAGKVADGEDDMSYFAAEHSVVPQIIPELSREISPKDIISLWKVFWTLWKEKPDIIHTHTAKAGTIGRTAGYVYRLLSFRNVRIVHTYHGHIFHSYYSDFKTKVFLLIEKTLAWIATDRIIVISQQQLEEIHGRFGVGSAKQFEVISLGIDLSRFKESEKKREIFRREINATEDEILVGLIGRLTGIKDHSFFLDAIKNWAENRTTTSPRLKFVIIGDGSLRSELERQVKEYNIAGDVVFCGNRNDPDIFYAGLDIVALTSKNEGTPLSLIEAMANSRAVISTMVGGVVDLLGNVIDSEHGFLICERGIGIQSGDLYSYCKGLEYLAINGDLRQEIGKNSLKFVTDFYSRENLVLNIKKLYQGLFG